MLGELSPGVHKLEAIVFGDLDALLSEQLTNAGKPE
jgi:hypothetical protein